MTKGGLISMSWTGWKEGTEVVFPGFQVNIDVEGGWVHYLVAPLDEEDPNENHIHVKVRTGGGAYIVAAVKVDGIHEVNRRELIDAINKQTGLNLSYR